MTILYQNLDLTHADILQQKYPDKEKNKWTNQNLVNYQDLLIEYHHNFLSIYSQGIYPVA